MYRPLDGNAVLKIIQKSVTVRQLVFGFSAATRRGRKGRLGVRLPVWEVPLEDEEDGQLQKAKVEVSHGATGEDGTCSYLCTGVFSGTRT